MLSYFRFFQTWLRSFGSRLMPIFATVPAVSNTARFKSGQKGLKNNLLALFCQNF